MMEGAVYIKNGDRMQNNESGFASPKDFLARSDRGAYTAALVRNNYFIVDWEHHLQRLCKSLIALHEAIDGLFAAYYAHLEAAGGEEHQVLTSLMAPSVLQCLRAMEQQNQAQRESQGMLIILLCPGSQSVLDIHVMGTPSPAPSGPPAPGHAVVLAPPRQIPIGKDSGWVLARKPWEDAKPRDAVEVLLCCEDGKLLEGLVTNLFIVTGTTSDTTSLKILTASTSDGVVWGTMRQHVLEVCDALGVHLMEEAPHMDTRATWQEAFLTNSMRIIQPLSRISCGEGNAFGLKAWNVELDDAPGPITSRIYDEVLQKLPVVDIRSVV